MSRVYSISAVHSICAGGVSATEKREEIQLNEVQSAEIYATIHYADDGPSLESCMVAILNAHLSENANF